MLSASTRNKMEDAGIFQKESPSINMKNSLATNIVTQVIHKIQFLIIARSFGAKRF